MNGWTEERKKKQADAIKKWKPWLRSTGPITLEGKKNSSKNPLKHGGWSIESKNNEDFKTSNCYLAAQLAAQLACDTKLKSKDIPLEIIELYRNIKKLKGKLNDKKYSRTK
jgi:hypothetical protein